MNNKSEKRFTGMCDKHAEPLYEGDIVATKYGRHCKIVWFESPVFSGWDLVPVAKLDCQAPDKFDLWDSDNLTFVCKGDTAQQSTCKYYERSGKSAYCHGTKDQEPCYCSGDRCKCDFYAEVRARAAGTFEAEKEAAIAKLQRLGVLDEDCQIAEEFRNILMKK